MTDEQKALSPWRRLKKLVRNALTELEPNFGQFDSPIYGKVLKVNSGGGKVNEKGKGFSIDVQPLNKDFSTNADIEKITDIPIDHQLFAEGGGIFRPPAKGNIVRIAFMYNDSSFPFIVGMSSEGRKIPSVQNDEFTIQTKSGHTIIITDTDITVRIKGTAQAAFQIKGANVNFKNAIYNTDLGTIIDKFILHTHLNLGLGVPTSPILTGAPPITILDFNNGSL